MIDQNVAEFEKMNLNKWHSYGYKGKGSSIVVLDVAGKPHEHTNVIEPIPSKYTDIGHQTNVCSVVREIAPEATIYSFHWSSGFKDKIIDWIKEHEEEIDVINFSVSSTSVRDEFYELEQFDIPVVVSSGNQHRDSSINPYAKLDWTLAVGAWIEYTDSRAGYSNYGEGLDLVAYTNIYIPTSEGYDKLMYFGGTSCSAPVLSGLIGVYGGFLREKGFQKMSRDEAYMFFKQNTIDKLGEGYDFESGHGLAILPKDIPNIEAVKDEPVIEEPIEEEDIMADFKDTQNHWAREYIDFVADKGLMKGYEDDLFRPDAPMTRAEVATVIARMQGYEKK